MRSSSTLFAAAVLSLLFAVPSAWAQVPYTYQWGFTSPTTSPNTADEEDWLLSVIATADGGYLAGGWADLDNGRHASLVKLDAAGSLLWEKILDLGSVGSVLETPTHYVAGNEGEQPPSLVITTVSIISPNVTKQYVFTTTQLGVPTATEVQAVSMQRVVLPGGIDDGYIINGRARYAGGGRSSLLLRLNPDFTPRTFGGNANGVVPFDITAVATPPALGRRVRVTHTAKGAVSGFLAVGGIPYQAVADDYELTMLLQKFDANGKLQITKTYNLTDLTAAGPFDDKSSPASLCTSLPSIKTGAAIPFDVVELGDGGDFMMIVQANFASVPNNSAGATGCSNYRLENYSYVDMTGVLVRLDPALNIRWAKEIGRFSGVDFQTPIVLMKDGLAITGADATKSTTAVRARVVKTNFAGDVIWTGDYLRPGDQNDCIFDAVKTFDDGIVMAGNNDLNGDDYVALKVAPVCVPSPSGLVARYRFNESSKTAQDTSVYGNAATWVNGPAATPGLVATALSFDGIDDYVQAPPKSQNGLSTGDFTISGWLRVTSADSRGPIRSVVDKRIVSNRRYRGYHIALINGELWLQLADYSGPRGFSNYNSGVDIGDGLWHFFAVTVQRKQTNGLRWYIDGVLTAVRNPTDRVQSLSSNSPLRFGRRTVDASGFFRGALDEIEIYNRALTPAEIAAVFAASTAGRCK
jgi:Concanavalin A-like lectin/glucanases superfamily